MLHVETGNRGHQDRFVGNWVTGGGTASWSQRRRLMAVLRRAHRVLGVDRKHLSVGSLGFGRGVVPVSVFSAAVTGKNSLLAGAVIVALSSLCAAPAHAQYAAGSGTATAAGAMVSAAIARAPKLRPRRSTESR